MSTGYLLDTNVFDAVCKDGIPFGVFSGVRVFATHIQRDELQQTLDPDLCRRLLATFDQIDPESVATAGAVWDVSNWDEACWSDDDGVYRRLLERVRELDRAKRKSLRFPNQERDALLAETAMKRDLVFVTKDPRLALVVNELGGQAISLRDFLTTRMASAPLTDQVESTPSRSP